MSHHKLYWLFVSPMQFQSARLSAPVKWGASVGAVWAYASVGAVAAAVSGQKLMATYGEGMPNGFNQVAGFMSAVSMLSAIGFLVGLLFTCAVAAVVVVVMDALFSQSGQALKLIECAGLSYLVALPWSIINLVIVAFVWDPAPLRIAPHATDYEVQQVIQSYLQKQREGGVAVGISMVGAYFDLWVVAIQACALRVVSGFTTTGAWTAGILLGMVFVVAPWAVQRF